MMGVPLATIVYRAPLAPTVSGTGDTPPTTRRPQGPTYAAGSPAPSLGRLGRMLRAEGVAHDHSRENPTLAGRAGSGTQ